MKKIKPRRNPRRKIKMTKVVIINQRIEDFAGYPKSHIRSIEHKYESNNWLKQHHLPMRRKPYKREYIIMDEFINLPAPKNLYSLIEASRCSRGDI